MQVNYRIGNACGRLTLRTTSSNMGSSVSRPIKLPNRNLRRVDNADIIKPKENTKDFKSRKVSFTTCTAIPTVNTDRSKSYQHMVTRHRALSIDFARCTYEFENVILQGGGNKAMAYCGAVRVRCVHLRYRTIFVMPSLLKLNACYCCNVDERILLFSKNMYEYTHDVRLRQ